LLRPRFQSPKCVAAAAGTAIAFEATEVIRLPPVKLSVIVSAKSSARLVKVATPPETTAVVAPWRGPELRGHHT